MGSFFGGGTDKVDTTTRVQYPQWVEEGGEQLFETAQGAAERPYPAYDFSRIAGFNPDQQGSFDLTRANVGAWQPAYSNAFGSALNATMPVGQEDISRYMDPYTESVINPTLSQLYQQHNRDQIDRHGAMARRGSYLNEDRREVIDQTARERTDQTAAVVGAQLRSSAFRDALAQANAERNRQMSGVGQFGNLAGAVQSLGAGDVAALGTSGQQQQGQEQANLDLAYSDFLRQFGYPQEQINYLLGILSGTPYGRTQTGQQAVAQPNMFAQALGGAATVAGLGGPAGFGWWGQ